TGVKLKGFTNVDSGDGIVNIDGNDYKLVNRTESTPSEYTIAFDKPVKSFGMQIKSNQLTLMATLSVSKESQTGIEDIISDSEVKGDGKIYNLMGIEVKGNLAPGIYIRDGKKFLVK
ncbi:MAG: hypothetical protein K2G27_06865, partial [Duncaniella sp.]|nr:hypothetical protein [Duncaniella sp.]